MGRRRVRIGMQGVLNDTNVTSRARIRIAGLTACKRLGLKVLNAKKEESTAPREWLRERRLCGPHSLGRFPATCESTCEYPGGWSCSACESDKFLRWRGKRMRVGRDDGRKDGQGCHLLAKHIQNAQAPHIARKELTRRSSRYSSSGTTSAWLAQQKSRGRICAKGMNEHFRQFDLA